MRLSGAGRLLSGAEVRMMIQPEPVLAGRVKLPVNLAPASRVITSPGCARLSAARKSPPAATAMVRPTGGTEAVSTRRRGSSGSLPVTGDCPDTPVTDADTGARSARRRASRAVGTTLDIGRPRNCREVLAVDEDALPDLEVHQEPEASAVLRGPRSMLLGEAPEERRLEEPSVQRPRPQHKLPHDRPEWAPQPPAYRNREAHLPPREDFARHQISQRSPQHGLGAPPLELEAAGDRRDVLDELVVQIRHPALDRGCHAHLILFHQELDQICLEIRVAHPLERSAGGFLVTAKPLGVGVPAGEKAGVGEKLGLEGHRKRGEVLVKERARPRLERRKGPRRIPAHWLWKSPRESPH